MQGMIQQIIFQDSDADIVSTGDHVRRRLYFVNLKNGSFAQVALRDLPGASAKIVGIVQGQIVVPPVGDVFHGASAGDRSLEARGLRDQPVGHVATVAVSSNRQVLWIGNAILDQRIYALQNIFAGTRDELGNQSHQKLVAV